MARITRQRRRRWLSPFMAAAMGMLPAMVSAELERMSENELSDISGAGIGLVLEDFKFAHGTDVANGQIFKIGGHKE